MGKLNVSMLRYLTKDELRILTAVEMGMTPLQLREANLMEQGDPIMPPPKTLEDPSPIVDMIEKVKASSEYDTRRKSVDQFNAVNHFYGQI